VRERAAQPPSPAAQPTSIVNALTIDVEDYFHVSAFESVCDPCTWGGRECRVESNTDRLLEILAGVDTRATFFVLGWVAERFPGLAGKIAAAGHEVACHGYAHRRVSTQTREEFREDVRRSKSLLEEQAGGPVLGYRAPSYSIGPTCLWAFDELAEAGFAYDSSVFPVRHDLYGLSDWPRFPFWMERIAGEDGLGNWVPAEDRGQRSATGNPPGAETRHPAPGPEHLLEVPITTLNLLGRNVPVAGGGYFRLFPYGLTRWGLGRINREERRPFVFYLHPWELDPGQPRMEGAGIKSRFRHYVNLHRTESRFRRLLGDFCFAPLREVLAGAISPDSRPGHGGLS
jgi:polysaccharide deacetylase family protein (PEP-CTERM system associated)